MERLAKESVQKPVIFGLENVQRVHKVFGSPGREMDVIHVTGTNGKGTFCTKTAMALQLAGVRTGLFTSPHVHTVRERTQVDGELISKDFCLDFYDSLTERKEKIGDSLTYFDYQTVQALSYFREKKVQVAVIEVGMGGLTDSTNLIPYCLAAVVTNIALDHTEVLGKTREEILAHKLGIVKPGCPTIIGSQVPRPQAEDHCRRLGSSLFVQTQSYSNFVDEIDAQVKLCAEVVSGRYDYRNQVPMVAGSRCMPPCRLQSFLVPAYLEEVCSHLYFDVGHNPDAIEKIIPVLEEKHPHHKIWVVFGCKANKDMREIDRVYSSHGHSIERVWTTSLDPSHIKAVLSAATSELKSLEKREKVVLLVNGSFHMMTPGFQFFGLDCEPDHLDMNDTYRLV